MLGTTQPGEACFPTSNVSSWSVSSFQTTAQSLTTTFIKHRVRTVSVVACKSSSRHSLARLSSTKCTRAIISRPRFVLRKTCFPTSNVLSWPVSSLRAAAQSLTTTFSRHRACTVSVEACKSSSGHSLARPSSTKCTRAITSTPSFVSRKTSFPTNSVLSWPISIFRTTSHPTLLLVLSFPHIR